MKMRGKRKADDANSHLLIPEPIVLEKDAPELEQDTKTQRKSFTLITPTIHTGFSFSVMHLLSAVRKVLVSPHVEDNAEIENHFEKTGLPSLKIQEIVNHVRLNPGDPCILETQEPLQDLIRGALRIFSSRTAPLGAKGWKTLVSYEKSSKSWAWIGPLSVSSSDNNTTEETSAETWGIPHKMLVKLVDAFANWLKSGQDTLQQIGSLPAPPDMLPVLDEKERFRGLRAQKSLKTIRPSPEEVRAYFRKEELLRYSIPDRAFQYTAFDGRKSIVAPLRRGSGKPTSKARDHFMLKSDRPPHVTVLCLVRDAAARLPGSVGTRADVCTLIRDSQYIVKDVTNAQIRQVVSGALDRLHYERDPCVQFDGDRKLWVYLHRDKKDEDFEDDGTLSTKKWKRQRKDAAVMPAHGTPIPMKGYVMCKFSNDPTVTLGSLSVVALLISAAYGLLAVFFPNKGQSIPKKALFHGMTMRVFFLIAALVTLCAEAMLMWVTIAEGLHRIRNRHYDMNYKCPTAKTGLFGGGAFLALDAALFWLVCQMLSLNATADYLEEVDSKGIDGVVLITYHDHNVAE